MARGHGRRIIGALIGICAFAVVAAPAFAGLSLPETARARRSVLNSMLQARLPVPALERHLVPGSRGEGPVVVYSERNGAHLYYIFVPEVDGRHELVAPGSYIVRRRVADGAFDQIKVFTQRHEGSFVRIIPSGRLSRMELFVVNEQLLSNISVPISFEQLLALSFGELVSATASQVDWNVLAPELDHPGYRAVESMVAAVRDRLPSLGDAEDGAMDDLGRLVYIETLAAQTTEAGFNCSGFAKWIVDGLWLAREGGLLPIEPLKTRHPELRGTRWSRTVEHLRDPFFGLDWTRNLAVHVASLVGDESIESIHPESRDVRDVPAAAYIEDVGYRIEDVMRVLYWLAVREPGNFYLGSVNNEFGSAPTLRQHTHVVVFFPYFDDRGRFHAVVMERNVESGIDSLRRRYAGEFVHLVRVPADSRFELPAFNPVP